MGPLPKERESEIIREGKRRLVAIPDDFFLEGNKIIIRQEKDGTISVHPAELAACEAMSSRFSPFGDWEDDTGPETARPVE